MNDPERVLSWTRTNWIKLDYLGLLVPAWSAIHVLTVESFPTDRRATALGIFIALSRAGALLGKLFYVTSLCIRRLYARHEKKHPNKRRINLSRFRLLRNSLWSKIWFDIKWWIRIHKNKESLVGLLARTLLINVTRIEPTKHAKEEKKRGETNFFFILLLSK